MAHFTLTDYSFVINSVDLSDHVASITINYGAAIEEDTAMGDTAVSRLSGLIDWSMDLTLRQDFAASEVDATLFSLVGGAGVTAVSKPTSSAVSATNPSFTGTVLVADYQPIAGTVGDVADTSVTLQGSGVLTRATS